MPGQFRKLDTDLQSLHVVGQVDNQLLLVLANDAQVAADGSNRVQQIQIKRLLQLVNDLKRDDQLDVRSQVSP